jgi:hypothetical protein
MSIVQHETNTTVLDREIANLGDNLNALHELARRLPVGVTIPIDKRAAFAELDARVNRDFDRFSYTLAAIENGALY